MILDIIDLDQDVCRRAQGFGRISGVVRGPDDHVVGGSEVAKERMKTTLFLIRDL